MQEVKYLGGCKEAKERFHLECNCCDACHDDLDKYGIERSELEVEDGYYHVCCEVSNCYKVKYEKGNQCRFKTANFQR
jgi:hypothetical protein